CDADPKVTFNEVRTDGNCASNYTLTRTWTATDVCGNTASKSQVITVQDKTAPVLSEAPADVTAECSAVPAASTLTATDNCDADPKLTFKEVRTDGDCASNYTLRRTWTATDICGNTASKLQVITVQDKTAPVLSEAPADITAECSAVPATSTLTATDNCDADPKVTFKEVKTNENCASNYTLTRTWTATDVCGNTASKSQVITVQDKTAPVLSEAPADVTLECGAAITLAAALTATDNCDATPKVTFDEVRTEGDCASNYTLRRTWTTTDVCGNTASKSQVITVQDKTAPTFTPPTNITINSGENCIANTNPTITGNVTNINDTCDSNPTATYSDTECFGVTENNGSINAGNGNYFPFTISGFDDLSASNIEKIALSFATNQGKGRAEFTLVSPSGQGVILVGPYCSGGNCDDESSNTKELYLTTFYPNSSGYTKWNNANFIQEGVNQNMTPNGGTTSPNNINGLTSYVSSFENLTGPMNGTWFIYSRKQASVNGSIDFNSVCLTPASSCPSNKVITRTWTVTDACGNFSKATQTIKIQDKTAPVLSEAPADITAECSAVPATSTLTATDNCDADPKVTFKEVKTNENCASNYTLTRTWTATDVCGNTASKSQVITVQDKTAPVLSLAPADITVECSAVPAAATLTATDNCDADPKVTFKEVKTEGNCASNYKLTRTWTATDVCGNTASKSQVITVQDKTAPVLSLAPADVTAECSAVPATATLTATDNCDADPKVTFKEVKTEGNCASNYTLTRTWTATDVCGNTASKSQVITVQDKTAPVLSLAPADITVECSAVPATATLTATDNCDADPKVTFKEVKTEGNCASNYTLTRTWTATDVCGNTTSKSQVITVQDKTAPVLSLAPADVTAECSAVPATATLTATDNCDADPKVTFNEVRTDGNCASNYTLTRTWTATDVCGNTASKSQVITVQDKTAPVLSEAPADVTAECSAVPAASTLTATDNCDADPKLTFKEVRTDGDCASNYTLTRTWTATDVCGNTASKSQVITVQDKTAPVLSEAPADVTAECSAVPATVTLTATDNCDAAPKVTFNEVRTDGDCASNYTLRRTWTATDICGNTASKSQVITVQDKTAPVLSEAPADVTAECSAVPAAATLTATDNCDANPKVTFKEVRTNGNCASNYTLTRTWTATDVCGNTASKSQIITVQDKTAPVLSEAPADVTAECSAVPAAATLTATDNCDANPKVTFKEVRTDGNCASNYTLTRTWTTTDVCGNTASKSQIITVQDKTAPVLSEAPADATVECSAVPVAATLTATDNCDANPKVTFKEVKTEGNCASNYTLTRTWTATDVCGNTASKSQVITVQDKTAPVLSLTPSDITVECSAVPAAATLTATDNCDADPKVTFKEVKTNENCASNYTLTRTWTATDVCGNTASKSQVITVQDKTAPVLSLAPADITVECSAVPATATLTATDNCDADPKVTFKEVKTEGNCASNYKLTRTWTATDVCGNIASKSQVITVQDKTAPVIAALPSASTISCPAIPAFATATATDNCASAVNLTFADATTNGQCAGSYSVTRTWTATDTCGNTAKATQTINVQDTTAPTTTTVFSPTIDVNCDAVPTKPELVFVDNCSAVAPAVFTEKIINSTTNSYSIVRKWSVADSCGNTSEFTQLINVNVSNGIVALVSSICNDGEITTANLNDLLPVGTPTNGTWTDVNNSGALQGNAINASSLAVGDYIFEYKINDGTCPKTIKITMTVTTGCGGIVLPCGTVLVHNAFSPNGDGINENFVIDNIDDTNCYPDNTVEIYNRWGVLVYETSGYNNTSKVFKGISEGRTTISQSSGLPTGTYFYILNYTSVDGVGNIITNKKDGYLYLTK
ncbi:gliding motility-associated C-terminal domain-containing protein, partial [Flavobacterium sp. ZS1P14]|uniref:gliding motility-associated C-terminal domain-containing protein n=1 Tax=Flavobacterium sp. ZS1P14 TaxID=3401729 RepID=UPI003AAC1E27